MKSKGGRAKKANYSTVVMRIPSPIRAEVLRLMEEFYSSNDEKAVTGIQMGKGDKAVTGIQMGKGDKAVTGIQMGKGDKAVTSIEMGKSDKAVTGIEELNLSPRTYHTLKRNQINTVDELKLCDLKSVRNLGARSIQNIKNALAKC